MSKGENSLSRPLAAARQMMQGPPDNAELAELLSREAEEASYFVQRAMRRAARSAFLWPEEARDIVAQGRSLTELAHIGPFLEKKMREWIEGEIHPPPSPPIRAQFLTLTSARRILADNPAWTKQLRGDLQMHTTWSDGSGSVRDMAEAAKLRGYEYIAITDHSKGLRIANGIDEQALAMQGREIASLNAELAAGHPPLTILRSIEMNLSPTGIGDMDASAMEALDIVLGSFHSALRRENDQTERYLAAVRNPQVHILGHPRGRIFNYRLGLLAEWSRVFDEAARLNKAVEIDAYPDRQDLNFDLLKIARRSGVRISLGTDSHHPWQFEFIDLGLAAALLAKIPADRILNFMPVAELKVWAQKGRH
jgi:histidinol phosphatase-like PHP family hydrolase